MSANQMPCRAHKGQETIAFLLDVREGPTTWGHARTWSWQMPAVVSCHSMTLTPAASAASASPPRMPRCALWAATWAQAGTMLSGDVTGD